MVLYSGWDSTPQFVGCMRIRNFRFAFLREAFMRRNSKSEMWFIYKIAGNSNNTPSDVFMLLGILFSNSKTNIKEEKVENFKEAEAYFFILIIILWALLVKKSWCLIVRKDRQTFYFGVICQFQCSSVSNFHGLENFHVPEFIKNLGNSTLRLPLNV